MQELNKNKMLEYAYKHALIPNTNYAYLGNKSTGGSDCSNFISQILHFAGSPMRYISPHWFYNNDKNYSISWATAHGLYWLLKQNYINYLRGPKGIPVSSNSTQLGDLVFFQHKDGRVFHCAIITSFSKNRDPLITQHSIDALNKKINKEYYLLNIYYLRIYL